MRAQSNECRTSKKTLFFRNHAYVSWAQLEAANADVASQVKAMARRYGYDDDPMIHPQSLGTTTFKA
jgi:hypothetical protein